jgi:glycosyltransferase involved in cell wall biosynthesis
MGKTAIITACYNAHPDLIWHHFVSIDQQYADDIIHVVVDDNSDNLETRKNLLAAAESRKGRTVVIASDSNGGPGAARNRAIRLLAKMDDIEYACLLDIDDYFELDALKVRQLVLADDPDLIAVYGNKFVGTWENVGEEAGGHMEEVEKILEQVPIFDKPRLMRECFIPSCSVMFRWEPFLQHVGHFRTDVRLCEDWLVWRKLSMLGKIKKVDMPIYTQTMHGLNLTTNSAVLANHRNDMITTQIDFNEWLAANQHKGILQL